MNYGLKVDKKAEKFILKQDKKTQKRLFEAVYGLKENPRQQSNITKLTGYKNTFRKRIGDFRVVYEILDDVLIVHVLDAGNRGEIYNDW